MIDDQPASDAQPAGMDRPFVLDYQSAGVAGPRSVLPVFERIVHFVVCLILPPVCFLASTERYPAGPEYQSGYWEDYAGLIPTFRVGWFFYPFLIGAMVGALAMICLPQRAAQWFWVRFALYTGIVLAWQYSIIQVLCLAKDRGDLLAISASIGIPVLVVAAAIFAKWVMEWLASLVMPWVRQVRLAYRLSAAAAMVVLLVVCLVADRRSLFLFMGPVFPALLLAPMLTLSSFVILTRLAWQLRAIPADGTHDSRPYRWLLAISWLGLFGGAWKLAFSQALVEYAKLPKTAPDCYIATAAARGHARLVGSWTTHSSDGTPFPANQQLVCFKACELLLRSQCPRFHRKLRYWYDLLGTRIARRLTSPWRADLAYLALKPLQWVAGGVLWLAGIRSPRGLFPRAK